MILLLYTAIIISIIYCIIIYLFQRAWKKQPLQNVVEDYAQNIITQKLPFISVIIPFRNEKENLPDLLTALNNQSYPIELYEIIAVDDHSSDDTASLIKSNRDLTNIKIMNNDGEGKKDALKTGILKSCGQLIISIDADCLPSGSCWIETIAKNYANNTPSMLQSPVKMTGTNNLLSRFQSIEYMSLQMCGAGAIFLKQPVFCSGANLAYDKNDWLEAINCVAGKNNLSGDDVFLLHTFKKQKKKIVFIKDKNCCVNAKTEQHFKGFMNQRMRWGGKSVAYKDLPTTLLATTVFLCNLFLSISIVCFFFFPNIYFPIVFVMKIIVDYLLLKEGADFFDFKIPICEYILFSIIYTFYLTITAIGSLFANISWKGRKTGGFFKRIG